MKTSRILTLMIGMLALSAGLSAKDFEGKVRLKMTTQNGQSMFMNYLLKDGRMRVEMEVGRGGTFASIFDPAKQEMVMLMPDQKMYMVHKLTDPKKLEQTTAQAPVEFVRTGETETILGYRCEKILVKAKDSITEVWGAEGMGTFMGMSNRGPMGGSAPRSGWEAALAEHGFFPLRLVSRNQEGKEVMRMEAVSVESQSLPAEAFAVPADFKRFEMPSIPGLGGMNPLGGKQN